MKNKFFKWGMSMLLFLSLSMTLFGQNTKRERVEAEKVAFITKRMQLTPKQAQGFWPIHTEFEKAERSIKQKYRNRLSIEAMSEGEAEEAIEKRLRMEEELLALKKNYYARFKTVISPRQILLLQKANTEFRQYLLEEIRRRRNRRFGG
ncbi:MAG: hypothetical protein KTR30_23175 [Saprospiraceae bacterium]|nr:hypothetical protein [Saprospiraceae bacterium]